MSFKADYSDEFAEFALSIKHKIEAADGCLHLEMMRDKADSNIFFTYSKWESEDHLNAYRKSELFGRVWPKTKQWFADKPEAWSVECLEK